MHWLSSGLHTEDFEVLKVFDIVPQQFNYFLPCCLSYTKLKELDGMQDFSLNL